MDTEPFRVLGLRPQATVAEIRTRYRRLALRHHPDRNLGDPEAAQRFQRVLRAYQRALRTAGKIRESLSVVPEKPGRYTCVACGDQFEISGDCARCDRPLDAAHEAEKAPRPTYPEVEAMERALLRKAGRKAWCRFDLRTVSCKLTAGVFFFFAGVFAWAGPLAPAIGCACFATYLLLRELHCRFVGF